MKLRGFLTVGNRIPTELDVNRLVERFGRPELGQLIPYAEVEQTINLTRKDSRWYGVINAWRKRLQNDHRIFIKAINNEGLLAMDDNDKMDKAGKHNEQAFNHIQKAGVLLSHTERANLSDDRKPIYDHAVKVVAAAEGAMLTAPKKLIPPEL